jgi:hypothetical protein
LILREQRFRMPRYRSDRRLSAWSDSTPTNDEGAWRVQGLPGGLYGFEVSVDGFKTAQYTGIDLQANDQKIMDTSLMVGLKVETVEVKDAMLLIDTTSAVSGTVLTDDMMEELPSQSNAPTMFVELLPGYS